MGADILADGRRRAGRRPRGFCLAHAAERQGAERRKAAGGQAGAAQERAAIDPAAILTCKRGGK
jgi:hypothetical protein